MINYSNVYGIRTRNTRQKKNWNEAVDIFYEFDDMKRAVPSFFLSNLATWSFLPGEDRGLGPVSPADPGVHHLSTAER